VIVSEYVDVKISSSNFNWYKEKGYVFSKNDIIKVKVSDLTHGSSTRIDVKCEVCGVVKTIQVNNYNNQLKKHNFYACQKCNSKKCVLTSIDRYGCSFPFFQNLESIKKTKETLMRKYGVDNISKVDFIRYDRHLLMKENTQDYNNIIQEKYGMNVSKLDWVKDKKKQTTMKNYGVENPTQNSKIFEKAQITGKKIKLHKLGLYYRGTYEKDFLDFCLSNNIEVESGITIKYNYNNKKKVYYSDFYIPIKNLIVEIKSSYYYSKYLELNELKKNETIKTGYNHIFIIDKDYTQFLTMF